MLLILIIIAIVPFVLGASSIPVIVTEEKNYTTSNPMWLTSPYFRAGYEVVISSFTGSSVPSTDYTFTFSSALPGIPNLAYGIKQYRGNDYLGQEFYQIKQTGLTAATFSVSIQIFGVTNLWTLTVNYLAVDPTFPHHLNSFNNVPINATGGDIVNISVKSSSLQYYTQYINYTNQTAGRPFTEFTVPLSANKIVLFMSSLWIRGTFGSPVRFHISTEVLNQSFYMWNATLQKDVLVTNVHFSQVIFNSDDVQSSQKYFIVYRLWYNDDNGGFLEIPQQFVDNFVMGVTTFECSSAACGFEYQWMYTNKTISGNSVFGVQILKSWTLSNTCGFSWSETSIFYMMTWQCQAPYYYFNLTSGLCQTLCGGFTFENATELSCVPCQNTLCYQCEDPLTNNCTDCASYLHYELVDGQCVCMSGYLRATSTCSLCWDANTGCYNCSYDDGSNGTLPYDSSNFVCLSCNETENYFMDGIRCTLCSLSHCLNCENLTACAVCETGYDLSAIQTCIICHVTGCLHCSLTDPDVCVVCNQMLGYYDTTATQKCTTVCGDGIFVSAEEGCDDGNLRDGDGCSSACTIEADYVCMNGSTTAPSICSYNGSMSVTLLTGDKNPTSNSLTLTYSIQPSAPLLSLNGGSIDFASLVSFPNSPGVTVTSAVLDPVTNELVIKLDYSVSLQGEELTLQLTPPNVPQAVLVPTFASTWIVAPTNQLAAVVYSQEDYATLAKLNSLANGLVGSYLAVVALTLVFRKYIGLELAALYQIGYLSLLQNSGVSIYSQPITGWNYVFGYNGYYLSPLPKDHLFSPYAIYDYEKYFGFSNNMMVIVAGSVVGVAGLLLVLSMLTSKSVAVRVKAVATLIASEVGYTLMVFSAPNIITALCIEVREGVLFEVEQIWSKAFLLLSLGLLLKSHLWQVLTSEREYDVGPYLRKHSKFGIFMPIVLSLRTAALTILLFVYHITQEVPQYFLLLVQAGYVFFTLFGRPHKKLLDFGRSLWLEVGLLYILVMRFVEIEFFAGYSTENNGIYSALAYTEYVVYFVGCVISIVSLIYHIVKAIKGRTKVQPKNESSFNRQKGSSLHPNSTDESFAKLEEDNPNIRKSNDNSLIFDIKNTSQSLPQTTMVNFDSTVSRKIRARRRRDQ